jgi:pantetheine-phosphate adenylyltransferase
MKKIAVFPGSFDPITLGHVSVVERALPLFDEILVAIGNNSQKQYMFDLEQRKDWISGAFRSQKIKVDVYHTLTVEYCKNIGAQFLLRGLRNQMDFEYERSIAQMNRQLAPEIDTVFLFTELEHAAINSSIVRDIIRNQGDASQFLPQNIKF